MANFIITRKELGWRADAYLESLEHEQALDHVQRYNTMSIKQVMLVSRMARVYSSPQSNMRNPPKEFTDLLVESGQRDDVVALDVNVHPKLISIGFIHCMQELASVRQCFALNGMPQDAIDARIKEFRDQFVTDFGTPILPSRFAELSAARDKLATLDVTGTSH